ncbi:hypothetical protein VNO80_30083 [Phaseolus coccineus]|uniref:Uncharacterized protein n=1 Tax=Phaseolus coccineus TaxID=3886 RepID=A0AAN9LCL0_PHACN
MLRSVPHCGMFEGGGGGGAMTVACRKLIQRCRSCLVRWELLPQWSGFFHFPPSLTPTTLYSTSNLHLSQISLCTHLNPNLDLSSSSSRILQSQFVSSD